MKYCVGISGSIAAYRSPDFVKALVAEGHEVRVILTRSGREFVSAKVLESVSGNRVLSEDVFSGDHQGTDHIDYARWADRFVLYAASANLISKYSLGLAEDFLTIQLLATRAPVWVVPAMNPAMWENPIIQEHVSGLKKRGAVFVGPVAGKVICGEEGVGHIASDAEIFEALSASQGRFSGKKVLISAGPMRSSVDSVRFIQNRSSGKMGLELARTLKSQGARVNVLLGPVDNEIEKQYRAEFVVEHYFTASEYESKLKTLFPRSDWFISAAAVLDFEVKTLTKKMSRESLGKSNELTLPISRVPDFVKTISATKKSNQRVIAFAAEMGTAQEIVRRATEKLRSKGVDVIIANPVAPGVGPDADSNEAWLIQMNAQPIYFSKASKREIARGIVSSLEMI